MSHGHTVINEFTHQAEAFNRSPVQNSAATLQTLIDFLPLTAGADWLEVACGTGIVSRALAPRVASVLGVDLTPTMIAVATREATAAGLANLRYELADATRLDLPADSFDGAVTRFSLHHIPFPGRVVAEMARVVKPGGWVALADHSTSDDLDEFAWHQALERLRDPSHWANLTPAALRALGRSAGLTLQAERLSPFKMDFAEWISRGSGGPSMLSLIEQGLSQRPAGLPCFHVRPDNDGGRELYLIYHLTLWRRL